MIKIITILALLSSVLISRDCVLINTEAKLYNSNTKDNIYSKYKLSKSDFLRTAISKKYKSGRMLVKLNDTKKIFWINIKNILCSKWGYDNVFFGIKKKTLL